jgi:hypothetical protein
MENIEFTYTEQADGEFIQEPGQYEGTIKTANLQDNGDGKHMLKVLLETEDGKLFSDRIYITNGKSFQLSNLIKSAQIGEVADGQKVGFNAKMIIGSQVGFRLFKKWNKEKTTEYLNCKYSKPSDGIEL